MEAKNPLDKDIDSLAVRVVNANLESINLLLEMDLKRVVFIQAWKRMSTDVWMGITVLLEVLFSSSL